MKTEIEELREHLKRLQEDIEIHKAISKKWMVKCTEAWDELEASRSKVKKELEKLG
jgi:SMC interacting uncharacterized protein involved in chromosome segregation